MNLTWCVFFALHTCNTHTPLKNMKNARKPTQHSQVKHGGLEISLLIPTNKNQVGVLWQKENGWFEVTQFLENTKAQLKGHVLCETSPEPSRPSSSPLLPLLLLLYAIPQCLRTSRSVFGSFVRLWVHTGQGTCHSLCCIHSFYNYLLSWVLKLQW